MWSFPKGHANLACLILLQIVVTTLGTPQSRSSSSWSRSSWSSSWNNQYRNTGQVRPIATNNNGQSMQWNSAQLAQLNNQANTVCGDCPPGSQREAVNGPYCGRCVSSQQSCAPGSYMDSTTGQCKSCPCPTDPSGSGRFGTTCRVDVDGEVTCDSCPPEYTGRTCQECAPGTIRSNVPPYECVRVNSTSSFSVACPAGNTCPQISIPQIVQQRPPRQAQPVCPFTQQQQYPQPQPQQQQQQYQQQVPTCPYQNNNNNYNVTCPITSPCNICPNGQCPTACGTNQCPITCPTPNCPIVNTPPPPVILPPWTPPPPPPCPGPIQCPINPPITPPTCPPVRCPECPPCTPCFGTDPPVTNPPPVIYPPPVTNPPPVICPISPTLPPPVIIPPWTPPPPPPCPGPITCPIITPPPVGPTCPTTIIQPPPPPPPTPGCPYIPPPPLPCNPCGTCQQQECGTTICPDPCQPCPPNCPPCPPIPPCPGCPPCPGTPEFSEPCICDPRGTALQAASECICKVNAQGARCDQCKKGYFALSSVRPEGCISCFCSGLTDSCSSAVYYRSTVTTGRGADCTIELTDESYTVVYSQGSSDYTWDGKLARFNKGTNRRLFWSLPSCMKGSRVTSYGGYLSFSRMCSGSGNQLGADHEVIIVGASGATIFWTTFETQACNGNWKQVDVLLAESAYWSSWKGENYRRATRADIMEVLANPQLILIRATFLTNTQATSIKDVSLSTVTKSRTPDGVIMEVESCRCPSGYRGLSCENCAEGYYRDVTDMSRSVFGACKPCPCGKTAEGCHLSNGQVVCVCKAGFTGPLCQDKEVITITCDPFRIREVEGANIDFTCSFTTNSKRTLLMRLGKQGVPEKAVETTSLTKTITLDRNLGRVACEVVDNSGVTWAVVYCAVEIIQDIVVAPPPPPRIIAVIPTQTFICVNETESVTMTCEVHSFGQRKVDIEWRREGSSKLMGTGKDMTIHNCAAADSGTYICSASDGEVAGVGQVALMVRRTMGINMLRQYPVNATNDMTLNVYRQHGGDYPNYPYQADAPSGNGNSSVRTNNNLPPGHPRAVVEPSEVIAKPGDTVILRCNATGEEPLKFYWKSGNNDYIPAHVRVSHGALIFRNVRSHDAGPYYCVAWNHLGQSTSRATIILDVPAAAQPQPSAQQNTNNEEAEAEPLTIEILNSEINARNGENVNFQCKSNTTGVTYEWNRLGENMPNSSEIRKDGLLTLYRVSEPNQGTYVCTVIAPNGERKFAKAVLKIVKAPTPEILVPPRIAIKPKSPLRVRTGTKVRIECESLGNPLPNVTWVKSVDGQDKKLVSTSNNKAIYEIKQMSAADVGKYTCHAINAAGRKSESMSIVIDDGLPCKESEFRCKSGDQCIPREDRCDSEKDCRDGSDELNCKVDPRVRRNHSRQ